LAQVIDTDQSVQLPGDPAALTIEERIKDAYQRTYIYGVDVRKVVVDGYTVEVDVDLFVNGAWMVAGTFQLELDDDSSLAKALGEIVKEDGNE